MDNKFSYEALSAAEVRSNAFIGFPEQDGEWLAISPTDIDTAVQTTGWKFHLSVAREDVPKAWDIVSESIQTLERAGSAKGQSYGLHAKVATPQAAEKMFQPGEPQAGKTITLYEMKELPLPVWKAFLSEVELRFQADNVRPGLAVQYETPVQGSQFASYSKGQKDPFERIDPIDRPATFALDDQFSALSVDPASIGIAATIADYEPPAKIGALRPGARAFASVTQEFFRNMQTAPPAEERPKPSEEQKRQKLLSDAAREMYWQKGLTLDRQSVLCTRPGYFDPTDLPIIQEALEGKVASVRIANDPIDQRPSALAGDEGPYLVVATDTQPLAPTDTTLTRVFDILRGSGATESPTITRGLPQEDFLAVPVTKRDSKPTQPPAKM